MSEQLKPCPFCGKRPTPGKLMPRFAILRMHTTPDTHPERYYWGCTEHTKHMHYETWMQREPIK